MQRILTAFIFSLCFASPSAALTYGYIQVTELLSASDLVIHGRIRSSQEWQPPGNPIIYRLYQVEVLETIGDDAGVQIGDFVTVGERTGFATSQNARVGLGWVISFELGEEAILLLSKKDHFYVFRNQHQGVMRVVDGGINPNPSVIGIGWVPFAEGLASLHHLSKICNPPLFSRMPLPGQDPGRFNLGVRPRSSEARPLKIPTTNPADWAPPVKPARSSFQD